MATHNKTHRSSSGRFSTAPVSYTHPHTWPHHTPSHSELLDRLQTELEDHWPLGCTVSLSSTFRDIAVPQEILPSLFQGRLTSKVRLVSCACTEKWAITVLVYLFFFLASSFFLSPPSLLHPPFSSLSPPPSLLLSHSIFLGDVLWMWSLLHCG